MEDKAELWKARLDLLTKDYEHRTSDAMFHSGRYHRQANFLQLFLATLIAVSAAARTFEFRRPGNLERLLEPVSPKLVYALLLCIAVGIAFYLFSNVMEALFMIFMNNARLSALEKRMNSLVEEELLVWHSKIVRELLEDSKFARRESGTWSRVPRYLSLPQFHVLFWSVVTFSLVMVLLSILFWAVVQNQLVWVYVAVVLLLTGYHFWKLMKLNRSDFKSLRTDVHSLSNGRRVVELILVEDARAVVPPRRYDGPD